ncbi:hypothetical protein BGZ73_009096 [Actinomortierella ambigua]|nr:hypothetical protein BGZ73_009096 [Actinomortierella ambigua]
MSQEREFDIVVHGATGFTGKRVVHELLQTAQAAFPERTLRVAIAGRSQERLEQLLQELPPSRIEPNIVIADTTNAEQLVDMCRRSKVCIACAGPFRFLGEPVVKACVETGCHYVDITGEPEFFEKMGLVYHEQAKATGTCVVNSCGIDSIPCDLGVHYTRQQLETAYQALPSTISMYFKLHVTGQAGITGHYGTYESAVHGFANAENLRQLRKKANRPQVPRVGQKLAVRTFPHWAGRVAAYCIPFFFADPSVVRLSQQLAITEAANVSNSVKSPIQFSAYICIPSFSILASMMIASTVFGVLAKFETGRKLLLKYPKFFTFGGFSHEGPTEQQLAETSFSETFFATGYSKALQEEHGNSVEALSQVKPDVEIVTTVSGPEPGYVATPKMVVQAAYTLLLEKDKMPNGVLTPATAFADTKLLERLQQNGIIFSTVHQGSK